MPARRSTASSAHSNNNHNTSSSNDDDVKKRKEKREKNNIAVKKTRQKLKDEADQRNQRVEKLRVGNHILEGKISSLKNNVETLKDLILKKEQVSAEERQKRIDEILAMPSDDEEDDKTI